MTNATHSYIWGAPAMRAGGDRPVIELPLTSSLTSGIGTLSSFSRASTATVTDFEGIIKDVQESEARFVGARRVENMLDSSLADFTTSAWHLLDYDYDAKILTITVDSDIGLTVETSTSHIGTGKSKIGDMLQGAMDIRIAPDSAEGTSFENIEITSGNFLSSYIDVIGGITSEWKRFACEPNTNNVADGFDFTSLKLSHGVNQSGLKLQVRNCQFEKVNGQANQNPSEYVSVYTGTEPELNPDTDILNEDQWVINGEAEWFPGKIDLSGIGGNIQVSGLNTPVAISGRLYAVTITIENFIADFSILGMSYGGILIPTTANGTFTTVIRASSFNGLTMFDISSGADMDITYISVKEIKHGSNVDGVKYFNTLDTTKIVDLNDFDPLSTHDPLNVVPNEKVIVIMGDSLSVGDGQWDERLQEQTSAILVDRAHSGYRLSTANAGNSVESKWRTWLLAEPTKEVFIAGGTNDINQYVGDTGDIGITIANMQTAVQTLHRWADEAGINIAFWSIPPLGPSVSNFTTKQAGILTFNVWLSAYCQTNNLTYFDVYSILALNDELNPLYTSDDIHLNAIGSQVVADYIMMNSDYISRIETASVIPAANIDTIYENGCRFSNDVGVGSGIYNYVYGSDLTAQDYQSVTAPTPSIGATLQVRDNDGNSKDTFYYKCKVRKHPDYVGTVRYRTLIYNISETSVVTNGVTGSHTSDTLLTTDWVDVWIKCTNSTQITDGDTLSIYNYVGRAGDVLPVQMQFKDVQVVWGVDYDQDFHSTDVLAHPYHGTGTDGEFIDGDNDILKKVLIEKESTNSISNSEDMTDTLSAWSHNNVSVALSSELLSGKKSWDIISLDTVNGIHSISEATILKSADEDISFSCIAKAGNIDHIFLRLIDLTSFGNAVQFFDITNGSIGTSADSAGDVTVVVGSATIEPVKNGYLCKVVISSGAGVGYVAAIGVTDTDGNIEYIPADTTNVQVTINRAQAERSSYPTSHIPTFGTTFPRLKDINDYEMPASMQVADLGYTIMGEFYLPVGSAQYSGNTIIRMGSSTDSMTVGIIGGKFGVWIVSNSAGNLFSADSASDAGAHKFAMTYDPSTRRTKIFLDGISDLSIVHSQVQDLSAGIDHEITVGVDNIDATQADSPVGNFKVFKKILSDAHLTAWTTP